MTPPATFVPCLDPPTNPTLFQQPYQTMLTKILIINTHTGTNLVLYVIRKKNVYILVVPIDAFCTQLCAHTRLWYTYILLYKHTLTMVEYTFVVQIQQYTTGSNRLTRHVQFNQLGANVSLFVQMWIC